MPTCWCSHCVALACLVVALKLSEVATDCALGIFSWAVISGTVASGIVSFSVEILSSKMVCALLFSVVVDSVDDFGGVNICGREFFF